MKAPQRQDHFQHAALIASVEHRKGAKEPMIAISNREFPFSLKLYSLEMGNRELI
jgi:hypothetical protein